MMELRNPRKIHTYECLPKKTRNEISDLFLSLGQQKFSRKFLKSKACSLYEVLVLMKELNFYYFKFNDCKSEFMQKKQAEFTRLYNIVKAYSEAL